MTLVTPTITPIALGAVRVTWSGDAGATVRVFVNGLLIYGPTIIDTAAKSLDIALPDPGTIEVHESVGTENVPSASEPLERKPLVWWSSVDDAVRYEVYFGSTMVGVVYHEDDRLHHEIRIAEDIRQDGGVWTTFRVEAISAAGATTTTSAGDFYAPGVLEAPASVGVTGGGGVFDITVTP